MKRKFYEKPTMQIVKLQHTGMLMTSGSSSATVNVTYSEENWDNE
jgi:hypothetical protein